MSVTAVASPGFSPIATTREFFSKQSSAFAEKVTGDWTQTIIKGAKITDGVLIFGALATGASVVYVVGLILVGITLHIADKHIGNLKNMKALDKQVQSLSTNVQTFSDENTKLKKVSEDLKSEVQTLGTENTKFKTENDRLSKTRVKLKKQNKRLEKSIDSLEAKVKKFKSLCEKLSKQIETFQTENKTLIKTNVAMKTRLGELDAFSVKIQKDLSGETEKLGETRVQLDESVDAMNLRFSQNLGKLEGLITTLSTEKTDISGQLERTNTALETVVTLAPVLRKSIQDTAALDVKMEQLSKHLAAIDKTILQKAIDRSFEAEKKYAEMMGRATEAERNYQEKLRDTEKASKRLEDLTTRHEALADRNERLHTENLTLAEDNIRTQQQLAASVGKLVQHANNAVKGNNNGSSTTSNSSNIDPSLINSD